MLVDRGMVLTDPGYRLADNAGHTGSSTLGRGCGSSIATTQANRARELSNEEVAFSVGLRGPLSVPDGARLLDVVVDLGEASAVRVLGARVEHLPASPSVERGRPTAWLLSTCATLPVSAATRSSTWNSRPASARSRARYRMPLRSRTRTVCPSKITDQWALVVGREAGLRAAAEGAIPASLWAERVPFSALNGDRPSRSASQDRQ
jgi:hypothetical protein